MNWFKEKKKLFWKCFIHYYQFWILFDDNRAEMMIRQGLCKVVWLGEKVVENVEVVFIKSRLVRFVPGLTYLIGIDESSYTKVHLKFVARTKITPRFECKMIKIQIDDIRTSHILDFEQNWQILKSFSQHDILHEMTPRSRTFGYITKVLNLTIFIYLNFNDLHPSPSLSHSHNEPFL